MNSLPHKHVLSIDPGLRRLGLALWTPDGDLRAATFVQRDTGARWLKQWRAIADEADIVLRDLLTRADDDKVGESWGIRRVVIEKCEVYDDGKVRGRQADILQLAGVLGALSRSREIPSERGVEWVGYLPKTWTQGRGKAANQLRIADRLSGSELMAFDPVPTDPELVDMAYEAASSDESRQSLGVWSEAVDAVGVGLYHFRRL